MEILKNAVKGFAVLAIIGVALALAAGPVAEFLGEGILGPAGVEAAGHYAGTALWTGVFFGGFGALNAVIAPALDWVFDKKESAATSTPAKAQCCEHSPDLTINNMQLQADMALEAKTNHYAQMIDAQRAHTNQALIAK